MREYTEDIDVFLDQLDDLEVRIVDALVHGDDDLATQIATETDDSA
jgi:hypothetical protein